MRKADGHSAWNSGAAPYFDWEGFQNRFFDEGKWKEAMQVPGGNLSWVEEYVKDLVSEAVPRSIVRTTDKSAKHSSVSCNVFETHTMLIAKIKVPRDINPQVVRVFLAPNRLQIKGLPNKEEVTVPLAANVRHNGSRAVCKDHVIEVRMPKERETDYKEVPVKYL